MHCKTWLFTVVACRLVPLAVLLPDIYALNCHSQLACSFIVSSQLVSVYDECKCYAKLSVWVRIAEKRILSKRRLSFWTINAYQSDAAKTNFLYSHFWWVSISTSAHKLNAVSELQILEMSLSDWWNERCYWQTIFVQWMLWSECCLSVS